MFFHRFPLILELFFNGLYILFFSIVHYGTLPSFFDQDLAQLLLDIQVKSVPFVILFGIVVHYLNMGNFEKFFRLNLFSIIIFVPMLICINDPEFICWLAASHLISSILALYEVNSDRKNRKFRDGSFLGFFRYRPAQIVLLSFGVIILLGTLLLMLPLASVTGNGIGFIDAFFMATSATCVTGLSTLVLNEQFSLFGQLVILILIQIGGLGFMTLSASMTILIGRSMAIKERVMMQDLLDVSGLDELIQMVMDIVKYTFMIELWGAIILTIAFTFEGYDFLYALYYGVFHSISSFCNAGFSLFGNSLESFSTKPFIHGTIAFLITFGGLGFIVLKDLRHFFFEKESQRRLTFHSKIVLLVSFILTVSGTLLIFFGEYLWALDGYNLIDKIQISFFQSVTLRTAGFNTIPLNQLQAHTIYIMCLYMFVGAGPGSTGGGIKTTTLAILFQSVMTTLRGRKKVEFFDRSIENTMVVRATAVTMISFSVICFFIFFMMNVEKEHSFLAIFFEVVSASGTVGLSLGLTPLLSLYGKLFIILAMFIGRVGPLTIVLAIGRRKEFGGSFVYPDGRLMIG